MFALKANKHNKCVLNTSLPKDCVHGHRLINFTGLHIRENIQICFLANGNVNLILAVSIAVKLFFSGMVTFRTLINRKVFRRVALKTVSGKHIESKHAAPNSSRVQVRVDSDVVAKVDGPS